MEKYVCDLTARIVKARAVLADYEAWLRTHPDLRKDIVFLRQKRAGGAIKI